VSTTLDAMNGHCTDAVNEHADEGRVEAVFGRKRGDDGIGHGLRDRNDADGNTRDEVTGQPCEVVAGDPREDREEAREVVGDLYGMYKGEDDQREGKEINIPSAQGGRRCRPGKTWLRRWAPPPHSAPCSSRA
jgi:hypothetical protein